MTLQALETMSYTNQADSQGFHHIFHDDNDNGFTYIRVRPNKDLPMLAKEVFAERVATMIGTLGSRDHDPASGVMSGAMMDLQYSPSSLLREQQVRLTATSGALEVDDFDEEWDPLRDLVAQHAKPTQASQQFVPAREVDELELGEDLQRFEYDHKAMGTCYGSEQVVMHPMVQSFIKNVEGEIQSLQEHLIAKHLLVQDERGEWQVRSEVEDLPPADQLMVRQIEYLKKVLSQACEYRDGHHSRTDNKWQMIDSNYYRDLLKATMEEVSFKKGKEILDGAPSEQADLKKQATRNGKFDQALYDKLFRQKAIKIAQPTLTKKHWDKIHAKTAEQYIPFLSNCWRQTARSAQPDGEVGKEISVMRFGAFYDYRNILFPLEKLLHPQEGLGSHFNQQVKEVIFDLIAKKVEIEESNTPKKGTEAYYAALATIDYALNRLGDKQADSSSDADSVGSEHSLVDHDGADDSAPVENWTVNVGKACSWMAERRSIAQTHFLSLLEAQVGQLKPDDKTLNWAHLSLLKPDEDKIEKMGWTHSEQNELLDMKWAFDHFRGAEITFSDEPGLPKIQYDDTGKPIAITLSRQHVQGRDLGEGSLELNSHLISCSVASGSWMGLPIGKEGARNTAAVEQQRKINEPFFQAVVDPSEDLGGFGGTYATLTTDEQKKRMATLRAGQSDFYAAEDLSMELAKRGWSLSVNCQSGKDRTGYVCSRLAQRVVLDGLEQAHAAGKVTGVSYRLKRYLLDKRPFDSGRVTQRVLRENTGARHLKVGVANLPGSDPLYLERLRHYVGMVFESIKGTSKPTNP